MAWITITLRAEVFDEAQAREMSEEFRGMKVLYAQKCPAHGTSLILVIPESHTSVAPQCVKDSIEDMAEIVEQIHTKAQGLSSNSFTFVQRIRTQPEAPADFGAYPPLRGSGEPV
jgi:hypothetical protein